MAAKNGTALLVMLAVAYAAFGNTFASGWTLDDFPVIVNNPDIRSWANFLQDSYPGRPLRELTFLADFFFFGLDPAGWHIQQIFWHGLNGFLVYLLGRQLTGGRFVPFFGALLFLLHPIQVEVVANISHRKDILALACCLAALLAYLRATSAVRHRYAYLALAIAGVSVGLTAKQNVIVMPAVFLACELALVPPARRLIARNPALGLGAGLLLLVSGLAWLVTRLDSFPAEMEPLLVKLNAVPPFSVETYLQTVPKGWSFSAQNLLFPFRLAPEYVFPLPAGWFDLSVLGGISLVFAVLAGGAWLYRHSRAGFFLVCWSLLLWLPVSNLWPLSYFVADRYWYAPSVGVFLAAGMLLDRFPVNRHARLAAAGAILATFLFLTWNQNRVWHSSETLWTQAVRVSPESVFALNNLGDVYAQKGDLSRAIPLFRKATEINPSFPYPHFNLGYCYEKLGDPRRAFHYFQNFLARAEISSDPVVRAAAQDLRIHLVRKYGVRF